MIRLPSDPRSTVPSRRRSLGRRRRCRRDRGRACLGRLRLGAGCATVLAVRCRGCLAAVAGFAATVVAALRPRLGLLGGWRDLAVAGQSLGRQSGPRGDGILRLCAARRTWQAPCASTGASGAPVRCWASRHAPGTAPRSGGGRRRRDGSRAARQLAAPAPVPPCLPWAWPGSPPRRAPAGPPSANSTAAPPARPWRRPVADPRSPRRRSTERSTGWHAARAP